MAKHGDLNLIILKVGSSHLVKQNDTQLMREREWMLGDSVVDELFEYKNLGGIEELFKLFCLRCRW